MGNLNKTVDCINVNILGCDVIILEFCKNVTIGKTWQIAQRISLY